MLLLFDIDGTLLAPRGAGIRAMERAGQTLFGASFSFFDLDLSGKIDPQIFGELIEVNAQLDIGWEDHDRFRDSYLEALTSELAASPIPALPGVTEVLATLRQMTTVTLGLLTGNYAAAAPRKLSSAGLEPGWFPVGAFGDEAPTRPELIPVAQRRYFDLHGVEIEPERVIVIGDTPRDVECAHANGCLAFAVATGRWSFEALKATGAEVVVEDLEDPSPLLELLNPSR